MAKSQIKVRDQGATRYPGEKIINFSSPNGGGLISFEVRDDGTLRVRIYNTDPTVQVSFGPGVRVARP